MATEKSGLKYRRSFQTISRENLLLLVWERPARAIAKYLKVSQTYPRTRCWQLQAPKPPPGYWAKVNTGQKPRKPLPKELSDQLAKFHDEQIQDATAVRGMMGL